MDDLVVHHRNRRQVAHRLGGDDRGVGADIGVVGRDQEASGDEIVVSRFAAVAEPSEDQNGHDESAQAGSLGRSRLSRQAGRWRMGESAGRRGPQALEGSADEGAVIARDAGVSAPVSATLGSSAM